jgi:plastocyanin
MSIGRSFAFVIALLVALSLIGSHLAVASAQEASPSPSMGTCEAPALPPGTPSAAVQEEASPEAEAPMEASPAEEATPVEPVGTPADEATAAEATAAAQNLVACIESGNLEGAVALMTPAFILGTFGYENPYDLLAAGDLEGTTFGNFTTDNVQTYDDGSVSVDVTYLQTEYQFTAERWFLVQDEGVWKIDRLVAQRPEPEGDTAVLGVNMTEYAFEPNAPSVEAQDVVMFHGVNAGAEPHEMIILQLPEGVTVEQLLADESLFEQVEFYGFAFFEPGQQGDVALIGLDPGVYTLVCFVTAPDGQPHAAHGMYVDIEVTAPAPVEVPSPSGG